MCPVCTTKHWYTKRRHTHADPSPATQFRMLIHISDLPVQLPFWCCNGQLWHDLFSSFSLTPYHVPLCAACYSRFNWAESLFVPCPSFSTTSGWRCHLSPPFFDSNLTFLRVLLHLLDELHIQFITFCSAHLFVILADSLVRLN